MQATLLVELLTEELPPKSLKSLSEAFAQTLTADLRQQGLLGQKSQIRVFATPRRLAVTSSDVLSQAPDKPIEFTGPAVKAALDRDGKPTQALLGFARKQGVDVGNLERMSTPKGEVFVYRTLARGGRLESGLDHAVQDALRKLPVAKTMRWGQGEAQFVRPVHGLMMLHGDRVVPGKVMGIESGNATRGHRFLGEDRIAVGSADAYEATLEAKGRVIADFSKRRERIRAALEKQAAGANMLCDDALLDEVTALVEWPAVHAGTFDAKFLEVPQECLILSMQQHQRYIPLAGADGSLLNRFLIVSNMQAADPANIVRGNERVLRARLSDAKFFYDQDRRERLEARVPRLAQVVYHNKLGSQLERVERIQLLAGKIARELGADPALAERAAWLAKADLLTGMVGEFPELQGVMGRYYALHDGEPKEVADAIGQHYRPRFSGDSLPSDPTAQCVALADKLDTLIGIFGIGLIPTGDKDPFALKRHALGVIRLLSELRLPLNLDDLLKLAQENFLPGKLAASHDHGSVSVPNHIEVFFFVMERAKSYLRDLGYSALEVESVLDLAPKPAEFVSRLNAVRSFLALPEAAGLAEADKRIRNILTKSGGGSVVAVPDEALMQSDAEKLLFRTSRLLRKQVDSLLSKSDFTESLLMTAQIHQPVSQFFDKVMVNVDDQKLRLNRFALLHEVINLTNRVANISKLAVEK